jgi:hypothetical protein
MMSDARTPLLTVPPRIINVGLASFAEAADRAGAEAVDLDWRPPADGDRELGLAIARLDDGDDGPTARANGEAVDRVLRSRPRAVDIRPAGQVVPGLEGRMLLHAGPPIDWAEMAGPMRGAAIGAVLLEGWADDADAAVALLDRGEVDLAPCHHHQTVGPMAGLVSPSMPVVCVEDSANDTRAYATLNEGLGKVLRFGAYDDEVLDHLRWMGRTLGPALGAALRAADGVDLRALTAQALQMGDECHNRNVASSSLMARMLAPRLLSTGEVDVAVEVLDFLAANDHAFLNFSMAACKVALDAADGVPGSTMVTAMCRNGVEFGIRVSGTGQRWFTAPASVADGLFFAGYGPEDASPDLGDSSITETFGIGGFAMAAAPSIVRFVGGTPAQAVAYTREMERITLTRNGDLGLPPLGFRGTPTGIDVRRVVETRTAPVINTGIAHREAGVGQIGAGVARAPLACFDAALRALADEREVAA